MFPPAAAATLEEFGHDARCVAASELAACSDDRLFEVATAEQRTIVTENYSDFVAIFALHLASGAPHTPVVCVGKQSLPDGSALGPALARRLDAWARANPEPYPGPHWP
ncbi:MAG: hypothetical protein F4Y76_13575 [Acidimicrobiales bacterium]|nr:hypothetical protein [Acidimicrobiales bacterium]MXZ16518.1 hypothetical protein [Acidimicrobiales bacterium]MYD32793.1 hypothetical protein [Acidimicrobiales bacterium]MYG60828.1 hypothetical protein [Acidimicrobiales bacterium]MYI08447.1 hypothetical protein [Acidimicrobiales bacterium]